MSKLYYHCIGFKSRHHTNFNPILSTQSLISVKDTIAKLQKHFLVHCHICCDGVCMKTFYSICVHLTPFTISTSLYRKPKSLLEDILCIPTYPPIHFEQIMASPLQCNASCRLHSSGSVARQPAGLRHAQMGRPVRQPMRRRLECLPVEQSSSSFDAVKDIDEIMKILPHRCCLLCKSS